MSLSPEELEQLRAMGRDLARATQSAWQPGCVVRAFRTPARGELQLSMQQWLDLDAVRSPLLENRELADMEDLENAARIFGLDLEAATPEEAALAAAAMQRACDEAWDTQLAMRPPVPREREDLLGDGFGSWLPIYACAVVEMKIDPWVVLALPVSRLLAIMAGYRRNQGWEVQGTPYAMRDVKEEEK